MTNYLLAPSIIASDFAHIADEVAAIQSAGTDWIHVDVMDGHFAPDITIGPLFVRSLKQVTDLPLDVHLMMLLSQRSTSWLSLKPGRTTSPSMSNLPNLPPVIEKIKSFGCKSRCDLEPRHPRLCH